MKAEVEKLFYELADQPPEVRERYFDEHEVDGSTRQEVEALLAFDSGDGVPKLLDFGRLRMSLLDRTASTFCASAEPTGVSLRTPSG